MTICISLVKVDAKPLAQEAESELKTKHPDRDIKSLFHQHMKTCAKNVSKQLRRFLRLGRSRLEWSSFQRSATNWLGSGGSSTL
jgi:hypothetical protein